MIMVGRIAAALVSGALSAQVHGLQPLWPLAWIAPVPLLIAVMGASRATAFLCGAIAGAAWAPSMFAYVLDLAGPAPVAIMTVTRALIWGGIALALRGAARHLPPWSAVFVFPALTAGLETLTTATSPHGSAGSLAYSQMDFLPAIQIASLGGAPAITFIVALFASAVAFLIAKRAPIAAIAPAALIAASFIYGFVRPTTPASWREGMVELQAYRIALLASDQFEGVPDDWRAVWNAYTPLIERAADESFGIVVLPEKIAHLFPGDRSAAIEQLAEIARRRDVLIVAGVDDETENGRFNRAFAFTREEWRSYDKRHMIPGFESHYDIGASDLVFEHWGWRFGVAICKDMDFPALGRRYAGVDMLLVPAWDFTQDAWLHSRMAVLRGVENGYVVVRSARNGVLTISDARGEILAEGQSGSLTSLRSEQVALGPGPTLYSRIGDAFGWSMLALAGLLIGRTIWRKRAGAG